VYKEKGEPKKTLKNEKYMKILHLTLKKKWWDMIASGEKKEEYREIKEYWWKRLTKGQYSIFKQYDIVRFKNGYAIDAPSMDVEWLGTTIRQGVKQWGAEPDEQYFVIKLGKVLNSPLTVKDQTTI
jgi:hypothetical protein